MSGNSGQPSRICVLGGGGFLGSHLVEELIEKTAFEVEAVDTTFEKLAVSSKRLRVTQASIEDPGVIDSAVMANDILISTTALCNPALYNSQPIDVINANYTHLVPLVELCSKQSRWLIHYSTCEVYGKMSAADSAAMNEANSPMILGPVNKERWTYACAKQLLERLIWAYGKHAGLAFTIIRPFNVIGPRMDFIPGIDGEGVPRVLACFMKALLKREPLQLVEGGGNRRAFIYVKDFTQAVLEIIGNPGRCQGEILNIGNPANDVTISELAEKMVKVFQTRYKPQHEYRLQSVTAEEFYGPGYDDSEVRIPDIEKISKLLKWQPVTTLDQMLPTVIEDYFTRYASDISGWGGQ
ncbi:MAG: NAD-dependent epimerase/dehydratase family protein [Deltaproteobacteria bacterium]|nr:NAD-dependent epimerase/dehydratase family protein [Deltaproteobacteria bacterium]MBW1870804.1 NAD-dependent epimerase/dehydratase family protein [Deltaproteobacteria bacterium]